LYEKLEMATRLTIVATAAAKTTKTTTTKKTA
jgi:hypothetical protein